MATYVCTESFVATVDGIPVSAIEGRTLVDENDDLYKRFPTRFRNVGQRTRRPEAEAATAAPTEKRGA